MEINVKIDQKIIDDTVSCSIKKKVLSTGKRKGITEKVIQYNALKKKVNEYINKIIKLKKTLLK